ncbi:MAG: DUF2971 domain-containing protein [Azonexaceae bacterium]|nr:DUF2971 domain-containing protein [Azonexaceae bacterium]
MNEPQNLSVDECPERFYKYRSMTDPLSVERVKRMIVECELYFAASSLFNDPFDLRPAFCLDASPEQRWAEFFRLSQKYQPHLTEEQHRAEADAVLATSLSPENIIQTTQAIQALHSQALQEVGGFCVSTKPDDILMWAHYADSHKGVCLEFDGLSTLMANAQKVSYAPKRVPINPYVDSKLEMVEKALLTKSLQWSYEDEWRLCRYKDGPGLVRYPPETLTGVILGALAPHGTEVIVRNWIQERATPVALYRAQISSTDYDVLIGPRSL